MDGLSVNQSAACSWCRGGSFRRKIDRHDLFLYVEILFIIE
jgi:hypothetical protein